MTSGMKRLAGLAAAALAVLVLAALVSSWPAARRAAEAAGQWTCSMHPQVRQAGPGRCPICGMNLIPVERLSADREQIRRQAGIETEPAAYRSLYKQLRTVGKLDYAEGRVAYITSRIPGRVDRLYVDFAGVPVRQNDHLVDIYSPELIVAQTELVEALRALERAGTTAGFNRPLLENNVDASRTRLSLLGILPEQIARIEQSRQVQTHLTIYAPIGGTVIEKSVRVGQYVAEGDMLYRIADLDPIWLFLDIYEYDLPWVRFGQPVEVDVEAFAGQKLRGTVTFIDPFLNEATRSVKVRVNLANPDRRLRPGMYASATVRVGLQADGLPAPTGLEGKYICPMHPDVIRDQGGRCPVCEMPLEPVPDVPTTRPPGILAPGDPPPAAPAKDVAQGEPRADAPPDEPPPGKVLSVRASAVLDTGLRKIVYRETADENFELVEVEVGPLASAVDARSPTERFYPVLKGLRAGDEVVVRGGFLLDSQTQIEGRASLLFPEGSGPAALHGGHGQHGPAAAPGPAAPGHVHPEAQP